MIELVAPYHDANLWKAHVQEPLYVDLGEHVWHVGDGEYPILRHAIAESALLNVTNAMLPPQYLSGAPSEEERLNPLSYSGVPLPWVWGSRWPKQEARIREILEPIVEEIEADSGCSTWRDRWSFCQGLFRPKLNMSVVESESIPAKGHITKWGRGYRPTWKMSVTGRMHPTGGVNWGGLSKEVRIALPLIKQGQAIWECDFVAAEPSLACTLLGLETDDAHETLLKSFHPDVSDNVPRSERKRIVMGALYGAGDVTLEQFGVNSSALARIHSVRSRLEGVIKAKFGDGDGYRSWGGRYMNIDGPHLISHWIQGSTSDIAFRAFCLFRDMLSDYGDPYAMLHDGCLWVLSSEAVLPTHTTFKVSASTVSGTPLTHNAIVCWRCLRTT